MKADFKKGILIGVTASVLFEFVIKPFIQKHFIGETA